ncbi:MAG: CheR family methyltransferase [Promethearchaeota archaeon]
MINNNKFKSDLENHKFEIEPTNKNNNFTYQNDHYNVLNKLISALKTQLDIDLQEYRLAYIERRIRAIMNKFKIYSYEQFLNLVKSKQIKKQEFLKLFTINVTKFFRDIGPFRYFESIILPKLVNINSNLHILSAACATGEEAYSIAIIVDYFLKKRNLDKKVVLKIDAIDIDPTSIEIALQGVYFKDQLVNISNQSINRNFTEIDNGVYKIRENLKNYIRFMVKDITTLDNQKYNCIFCRNFLIYIDKDKQQNILKIFWDNLAPNGYLILGKTETISVGYQNNLFEYENLKEHIYKKRI